MSSSNLVTTLRGIIFSMQKMKQIIGEPKVAVTPPTAASKPFLPTLELPFPQDILVSIDSMEFPFDASKQLRQLVIRKVSEAQLTTRQIFERTCFDVSSSPCAEQTIAHLVKIFQKNYDIHCISKIRQQLDSLLSRRREHKRINGKKGSFRFEYTPLLEQYFERNAYPTSEDRLWLAQKSKMTPRQIEVWFQNHRSRAKSQGKVLKRWDSKTPLRLFVTCQSESFDMDDTISSEAVESDWFSGDEASEILETSSLLSTVNAHRPPHAFPTPYPPKASDDPFPHTDGIFHFATPVWSRHPRPRPQRQHSAVDVNELADIFAAKLTLREASTKRRKNTRSCEDTRNYTPWFASTVTRTSSAPHPALIQKYMMVSSKCQLAADTRNTPANSSSSNFSSPYSNCASHPTTSGSSYDEANSRKVSLPKRIPNTHRMTPFDAYSSRCSSFSSTTSLDSISTTNETPITPPLSPSIESHDLGLILTPQDLDAIFAFEPRVVIGEKTDVFGDPLLTSSHPSLQLWSMPPLYV